MNGKIVNFREWLKLREATVSKLTKNDKSKVRRAAKGHEPTGFDTASEPRIYSS
jgi:hypothetical protein